MGRVKTVHHPELVGDVALISGPAAFGDMGAPGLLPRIARVLPASGCGAGIDREDGWFGRVVKATGEPIRVRIADLPGNARSARRRARDKIDRAVRLSNTFLTSCRGWLCRDAQLRDQVPT